MFFFVSGGVDSTVAYTLCLRALGADRVYGIYVDTGLMREGETEFVRGLFAELGATAFHVEDAKREFLGALAGVTDPEQKRHIIGEQFVEVQERVLEQRAFSGRPAGFWGREPFIPTPSNRAAPRRADLIKTHHNRVAGIQKLIDDGPHHRAAGIVL